MSLQATFRPMRSSSGLETHIEQASEEMLFGMCPPEAESLHVEDTSLVMKLVINNSTIYNFILHISLVA